MNREQITEGLRDLLKQQKQVKIPVATIGEETRLNQIGFDSLSILDFIYEVENRFGLAIEIPALVRMEQVRDLIDYLEAAATAGQPKR